MLCMFWKRNNSKFIGSREKTGVIYVAACFFLIYQDASPAPRKELKLIIYSNNFIIKHIADSGQCFRMNRIEENRYGLTAFRRYIELVQLGEDSVELTCTKEEYERVWKEYFDMNYNYDQIVAGLSAGDDEFLKNAVKYGGGLRILKQELFETLISFIISQRKSIPAIKSCIEQLCRRYGNKKISDAKGKKIYYTFPTPEQLAAADRKELRAAGLGYRDGYVLNTAKAVANKEIDLEGLKQAEREEALQKLMNLSGVGIKVANCVSLYGLHHIEAFPVDVWIDRILREVYHNNFKLERYKGFAGIVQQYMFYYGRSLKKIK